MDEVLELLTPMRLLHIRAHHTRVPPPLPSPVSARPPQVHNPNGRRFCLPSPSVVAVQPWPSSTCCLIVQKSLGALCITNTKQTQWFLPRAHIQEVLGSNPRVPPILVPLFISISFSFAHTLSCWAKSPPRPLHCVAFGSRSMFFLLCGFSIFQAHA